MGYSILSICAEIRRIAVPFPSAFGLPDAVPAGRRSLNLRIGGGSNAEELADLLFDVRAAGRRHGRGPGVAGPLPGDRADGGAAAGVPVREVAVGVRATGAQGGGAGSDGGPRAR